jgi:PEGA domain
LCPFFGNHTITKRTGPSSEANLCRSTNPSGADIEVGGNFVGNTPSALILKPGEHVIAVKKACFKDWQRKISYSGGDVNLTPELEKKQ